MSQEVVPGGMLDPRPAGPPARPEPHRHRKHPARRQGWQTALIALVAVAALAAGLAVGLSTWSANHYTATVQRVAGALPTGARPTPSGPAKAAVTFVVATVEPQQHGVEVDAVLLVRLTADQRHAQVVFLPLDAWLPQAKTTARAAFAGDGPQGLVAAIETTTGVQVNHYAQVDFDGFRTITDGLDGVDVDVPQPYQDLGYTFPAGRQHMDGAAALAYVRDADESSKATTALRMQAMIQAIFERASAQGLLSDFGRLSAAVGEFAQAVSVDDSLANPDLVRLAWDMRDVGRPDYVALPLAGSGTEGGRQVVYLDQAHADDLWSYLRADTLETHLEDFR